MKLAEVFENITPDIIVDALKEISKAQNVRNQDGSIKFTYTDKDHDDVTAFITIMEDELEDERITCTMLFQIWDGHFVTGMICANAYNILKDTHGTFAYAQQINGKPFIAVESHLLTRGGITRDALKYFLKNFIQHIDRYETIMIPAIKETGPDSSFLKAQSWSDFWRAVRKALAESVES